MEIYPSALTLLIIVRRLTMVSAGMAAFVEIDFKKIIAYSTLRQLGVMILALGLGSPLLSFFHLLSHAIFKALMFVCAGTYIFYHSHGQDLRIMGNLRNCLPATQVGLIVSNLALCGFPFLSGFYSKDPIYELRASGGYNLVVVSFMILGLLITGVYSFRSIALSQVRVVNQISLNYFTNNAPFFKVPVFILGAIAVFWGAALNWGLPPVSLAPISFILGVVPMTLLLLAGVFIFFVYSSETSVVPVGRVSGVKLSAYEGFARL
jgi:NADH-ubiquinone oxidoreductase chain 5